MFEPSIIKSSTHLVKGILIEQEQQHTQYYHPMEGYLTTSLVEEVMVKTNDGLNINPIQLSSVAAKIISPSEQPVGEVAIVHGMGQKRFSFMLEFVTTGTLLGTITEVITGYTDYVGATISGAIDPRLRFFVNDCITLIDTPETYVARDGSTRYVKRIKDDMTLLRSPYDTSLDMVSLRPEDTIAHEWSSVLRSGGSNSIDVRTSMSQGPKNAETTSTMSHRYLSTVLGAYLTASNPYAANRPNDNSPKKYNDLENLDIHDSAWNCCSVASPNTTFYHRALKSAGLDITTEFTKLDLDRIWNIPSDKWQLILNRPGASIRSPLQNSEHWGGATTETSIVYNLTHILPNIMGKFLIGAAAFTMTNATLGGEILITPVCEPLGLFENVLTRLQMVQLIDLIKLDVVHGTILPKAYLFDIYLEINLLGICHFEISINGGPKIPYDAPMFCDGIYSPLLGLNVEALNHLTYTVANLADNVISASQQYTSRNKVVSAVPSPNNAHVFETGFDAFNNPVVTPPDILSKYNL
jgi:hypothetical protein